MDSVRSRMYLRLLIADQTNKNNYYMSKLQQIYKFEYCKLLDYCQTYLANILKFERFVFYCNWCIAEITFTSFVNRITMPEKGMDTNNDILYNH